MRVRYPQHSPVSILSVYASIPALKTSGFFFSTRGNRHHEEEEGENIVPSASFEQEELMQWSALAAGEFVTEGASPSSNKPFGISLSPSSTVKQMESVAWREGNVARHQEPVTPSLTLSSSPTGSTSSSAEVSTTRGRRDTLLDMDIWSQDEANDDVRPTPVDESTSEPDGDLGRDELFPYDSRSNLSSRPEKRSMDKSPSDSGKPMDPAPEATQDSEANHSPPISTPSASSTHVSPRLTPYPDTLLCFPRWKKVLHNRFSDEDPRYFSAAVSFYRAVESFVVIGINNRYADPLLEREDRGDDNETSIDTSFFLHEREKLYDLTAALHSDAILFLLEYSVACGQGHKHNFPPLPGLYHLNPHHVHEVLLLDVLSVHLMERVVELSSKHVVKMISLLSVLIHTTVARGAQREGSMGELKRWHKHNDVTARGIPYFLSSNVLCETLYATMLVVCYAHRQSLRRVQNVKCLFSLVQSSLLFSYGGMSLSQRDKPPQNLESSRGDGKVKENEGSVDEFIHSLERQTLSHLLMRYITSKDSDNMTETSRDITQLVQFCITHRWEGFLPEVRSAALVWLYKHKQQQQLEEKRNPAAGVSSSVHYNSHSSHRSSAISNANSNSVTSISSRLPGFLEEMMPEDYPKEVFQRLSRTVLESNGYAMEEMDRHLLRMVYGSVYPSVHRKPLRRLSWMFWLPSSSLNYGGQIDRGVSAAVSHSYPAEDDELTSLENEIHATLKQLLTERGERHLHYISRFHRLVARHPQPSEFAEVVCTSYPTLCTTLVAHVLYREWPDIVFKAACQDGGGTNPSISRERYSMDRQLRHGAASQDKDYYALMARHMLRGLWMLLRRVHILDVTRHLLLLLPALGRQAQGSHTRCKPSAHVEGYVRSVSQNLNSAEALQNLEIKSVATTTSLQHDAVPPPPPPIISAVLRCVVAHTPAPLVRLVIQQAVEERELSGLPMHPYVLHFLDRLLSRCPLPPLKSSSLHPHPALDDNKKQKAISKKGNRDSATRSRDTSDTSPRDIFEGIHADVKKLCHEFIQWRVEQGSVCLRRNTEPLCVANEQEKSTAAVDNAEVEPKKGGRSEEVHNNEGVPFDLLPTVQWWAVERGEDLYALREERCNFKNGPQGKSTSTAVVETYNVLWKQLASSARVSVSWQQTVQFHEKTPLHPKGVDCHHQRTAKELMGDTGMSPVCPLGDEVIPSLSAMTSSGSATASGSGTIGDYRQRMGSQSPSPCMSTGEEDKCRGSRSGLFLDCMQDLMEDPEEEVRLLTIMATMQKKVLLVGAKQRALLKETEMLLFQEEGEQEANQHHCHYRYPPQHGTQEKNKPSSITRGLV